MGMTTIIITIVILVYALLFIFILFIIANIFMNRLTELSDFSVLTSSTLLWYVPEFYK